MTSAGGRTYAGQSEGERRADRRERLLAAGLQLFGELGWDDTSIDRLCTEAMISTRYFYEEFRSREELLETVYELALGLANDAFVEGLQVPGSALERCASGLHAYVLHVTADPGLVQLLHLDGRRVPSLLPIRERMTERISAQLAPLWDEAMPPGVSRTSAEAMLRALAGSGGMNEVLVHWLNGPQPRPDRRHVADQVALSLASALLAPTLPAA